MRRTGTAGGSPKVARLLAWILPRDHEDRVSAFHQIAHERVVWRKIKDVILQDPRGHDQHRLVPDRRGLRRALDQTHPVISIDQLSGRSSVLLAEPKHCTSLTQ